MEIIETIMYDKALKGVSVFSGDPVEVIGEQKVLYEGRYMKHYLYNIVGHTPENGKPFAALKANILIENS